MADYAPRNLGQLDDLAGQSARMEGGVRTISSMSDHDEFIVGPDEIYAVRIDR